MKRAFAGRSGRLHGSLFLAGLLSLVPFLHAQTGRPGPAPAAPGQSLEEPTGLLTLRHALALALARGPELAVFPHELRALEARQLQASLRPNPELSLEVENVLGTGAVRGFTAAETTLQLSRLVELGGKRLARVEAAARQRDVVAADYEVRRVEVLASAAGAFIRTLAAQEEVRLAKERLDLAQRVAATIGELVANGRVSPVEETRARAAAAAARMAHETAQHELAGERARLAAHWGGREARFAEAAGTLDEQTPLPDFDALARRAGDSPELRRWAVELSRRQAELALADARRVPDVRLAGGVRDLSGPDDRGLVFGVSAPLPLFDRNQGAREEARQRALLGAAEQHAAEVRLLAEVRAVHERLRAARFAADTLAKEILPAARQAFEAIAEGYRAGKFGYLDLLEAQRSLFDARQRHLAALASARLALVELERLLGGPLETQPPRP